MLPNFSRRSALGLALAAPLVAPPLAKAQTRAPVRFSFD